jgi:hypothetical protein
VRRNAERERQDVRSLPNKGERSRTENERMEISRNLDGFLGMRVGIETSVEETQNMGDDPKC